MAKSKPLRRKEKFFATLAVLATALSLVFLASIGNGAAKNEAQAITTTDAPKSGLSAKTSSQLYDEGVVKHFVKAKVEQKTLEMMRGESSNVTITLKHLSKLKDEPVVITNLRNPLRNFLPSAGAGLTDDQFVDLLDQPGPIAGEIPVNVSFGESLVTVPANSNLSITMTVSLPADLPEEVVGKTVEVGVSFQVQSLTSTTIEGGLLTLDVTG